MYIDFDDRRPPIPRVPAVISRRSMILVSIGLHLLAFVTILLLPTSFFESEPETPAAPPNLMPIQFVEVAPRVDRVQPPMRPAVQSDLDRRSVSPDRAPVPENSDPRSRGNTRERIEAEPEDRAAGPDADAAAAAQPAAPDPTLGAADAVPIPPAPPRQAAGSLGQSLRNLQRYLRDENFDNQRGGATDQGADIQFDSMGVDFGPWLRRFKIQIERNWLVPQAAESLRGRVVLQFYVLRNGTITDLRIVQASSVDAFTTSAVNALKLSNPTAMLPREYPADRVLFTVTFHYNEALDGS